MSVPAFVAAVQARDPVAARAALAPLFQGKANGKALDADGQVRLLESWWAGFPAANFALDPVGGSGRYVITWTLTGTHDGFYAGIPPTGKPIAFSGYIVAVADATGVLSLDWKWDPKVFTKAVLGPDDVGTLEVKDHFRADPSRRWSHGDGRHRTGQGKPKGRGGRQGGRGPQAPQVAAGEGAPSDGAVPAAPQPGAPGAPRPPGQGRRRRGKGRGPRTDGAAGAGAPDAPAAEGAASSAPSEGAADASPAEAAVSPPESKPDGT